MNWKTSVLAAVLMFFVPATAMADANQRLDDGEVIVTIDEVEGSELPRINVYGVIDAPPEKLWALISDCNSYVGVMPRVDKAREIRRSGSTVICDVTIGLPFPISDLQAVTTAEHTVGPPEWRREWELVEGDYEVNTGSWRLRRFQGDKNRTLAIYSVHAVPNNRVPNRLRKRAQESTMPDIIDTLREHFE